MHIRRLFAIRICQQEKPPTTTLFLIARRSLVCLGSVQRRSRGSWESEFIPPNTRYPSTSFHPFVILWYIRLLQADRFKGNFDYELKMLPGSKEDEGVGKEKSLATYSRSTSSPTKTFSHHPPTHSMPGQRNSTIALHEDVLQPRLLL